MMNISVFPFVAPYEEPRWLLFVMLGITLLLIGAYQLWTHHIHHLRLRVIDYLIVLFLLGMAVGIAYTPNPVEGVLRWSFWLSAFAVLYVTAWSAMHNPHQLVIVRWLVTLSSFTFSLYYWWQYLPGHRVSSYSALAQGAEQTVFFSPIGHVNFTGDVLVVLIPMLVWLIWQYRHERALLLMNVVSLVSMVAILLIGSGRGAMGGLIIGVVFSLCVTARHIYRYCKLWHGWKTACLLFVLLIFPSIVLLFIPSDKQGSVLDQEASVPSIGHAVFNPARMWISVENAFSAKQSPLRTDIEQPPLAVLWWQLQPFIAPERAAIYASATAMVADAPWLGHGTGSFSFIFPAYSNHFPQFRDSLSTMQNMASNPHNIFFQIASQNGVFMAVLLLAMLLYLWWRVTYALWVKPDIQLVTACIAITGALFDSMFNHVFFNPTSLYVFCIFTGLWWVWSCPEGDVIKVQSEYLKKMPVVVQRSLALGVVVLCIVVSVWTARWGASEWYLGHTLLSPNTQQAMNRYYHRAYVMNPYNFRAVAGLAEENFLNKKYPRTMELLEWLVRINPYDAVVLNNLASLHIVTGNKERATMLLKRALWVQPDFVRAKKNIALISTL